MSGAIDVIKACPLFYEFLDREIEQIVEKCHVVGLEPSTPVFEEGDEGNELYIILSGECVVKKHETILAVLRKGDLFGEMVLINENIRSARIVASTHVDLLKVRYEDIFHFYEKDPKIFGILILNLSRLLAKRLKDAGSEIRRLNSLLDEAKDAA